MQDTVRTIVAFYVAAGVWMSVMLATALTWLLTMGTVYAAFGLGPELRAAITMTVAITLATVVGAATWRRLSTARSSRAQRRPLARLVGSEAHEVPQATGR